MLEASMRYIHCREWEKTLKIQEPDTAVKFLGADGLEYAGDILSKAKTNYCIFYSPSKKEAQCLVGLP